MSHPIHISEASDIEQLIDRVGLSVVLKSIAEICDGKAVHLLHNWQDKAASKTWAKRSQLINKLSDDSRIQPIAILGNV